MEAFGCAMIPVLLFNLDTTTDLTLVGRNYSGYGIQQNENFLYLLENFANNACHDAGNPANLDLDHTVFHTPIPTAGCRLRLQAARAPCHRHAPRE